MDRGPTPLSYSPMASPARCLFIRHTHGYALRSYLLHLPQHRPQRWSHPSHWHKTTSAGVTRDTTLPPCTSAGQQSHKLPEQAAGPIVGVVFFHIKRKTRAHARERCHYILCTTEHRQRLGHTPTVHTSNAHARGGGWPAVRNCPQTVFFLFFLNFYLFYVFTATLPSVEVWYRALLFRHSQVFFIAYR